MKLGIWGLAVGAAVAVAGCRTYGEIRVAAPQAFARNRVIQERNRELQWLEGQLEGAGRAEPVFGAFRDVRTFTGIYNKLQAKWDPGAGSVVDLAQRAERNEERVRIAQQQVELAKLERELQRIRSDPPTGTGAADTAAGGGEAAEAEGGTPAPTGATPTPTAPAASASGDGATFGGGPIQPPKDLLAPTPEGTDAEFTFLERFGEKRANREAVTAVMHETKFDDTHDLAGYTLYDLRFDTSVIPGDASDLFAKVRVDLKPGKEHTDLHRRWLRTFERQLQARQLEAQRDWLSNGRVKADLEVVVGTALAEAEAHLAVARDRQTQTEQFVERLVPRVQSFKDAVAQATALEQLSVKEIIRITPHHLGPLSLRVPPIEVESEEKREEAERLRAERLAELVAIAQQVAVARAEIVRSTQEVPEVLDALAEGLRKSLEKSLGASGAEAVAALEEETRALGRVALEAGAVTRAQEAQVALFQGLATGSLSADVTGRRTQCMEIAFAVETLYAGWLVGIVPGPARGGQVAMRDGPETVYVRWFRSAELAALLADKKTFADIKKNLGASPRVLAVQPRELAQNVSQVYSGEDVINLMLDLAANLSSGVSGSNETQYVSRTQTVLNGIQRNPIAVGFASGPATFEWILGPRATLGDDELELRHRPAKHSFTVSVAVPAWHTSLLYEADSAWIDCAGKEQKAALNVVLPVDGTSSVGELPLPGDLEALTAALLADQAPRALRPQVDAITYGPGQGAGPVFLRAGQKAHLVVRGQELWRNPQVFLGHLQADRVDILADMSGLYATFERLDLPPTDPAAGTPSKVGVPVLVKTSRGEAVAPDLVFVVPAAAPAPVRPFVHLTQRFLLGVEGIRLRLDPTRKPAAFHEVRLRVTDMTTGSTLLDSAVTTAAADVVVASPVPPAPTLIRVQALLSTAPGGTPQEVLEGDSLLAWFPAAAALQPTFSPQAITFASPIPSISLTISPAKLFAHAFPGSTDPASSHTVVFTGGGRTVEVPASLNDVPPDGVRLGVSNLALDGLRGGASGTVPFTLKVTYVANGRPHELPVAGTLNVTTP